MKVYLSRKKLDNLIKVNSAGCLGEDKNTPISHVLWNTVLTLDNMLKIQKRCCSLYMKFLREQILRALITHTHTKLFAHNEGDLDSIPVLGRSPGEGNGNSLQYSCPENPIDRGAWRAIVHGIAKSQTWLSNTHTHTQRKFKEEI